MYKNSALTPDDLRRLEARWITAELAAAARLERVDSASGRTIVGRTTGDFAGLFIPNILPGQKNPREYSIRRDHPDLESQPDGPPKERLKYVSPPGRRNVIYFPPDVDPDHLQAITIPIVITEGQFKTLALWRLATYESTAPRFLPLGLSGVWNWHGVIGKEPNADGVRTDVKGVIPDFDLLTWAGRQVLVAYDSDSGENESVGRAKSGLAKELRRRGAKVAFLEWDPKTGKGIDDHIVAVGPEAVLAEIAAAKDVKKKKKPSVTAITATVGGKESGNGHKPEYSRDFFTLEPDDGDRQPGIHALVPDKTGSTWISMPLEVAAITCDEHGDGWGRLLKWKDRDGRQHSWAMPMQLLSGDGSDLRKSLLNGGCEISTSKEARERLLEYIRCSNPPQRGLSVSKVGWHGDVFVFPDANIGGDPENLYFYQPPQETWHNIRVVGTAEDWRNYVGRFCAGNSRLVLATSCAFAAPLLGLTDSESGGFHFWGMTSKGKSTTQAVAGSVWGGGGERGYLESWRTTANGLEVFAEIHNDGLGCLDEIKEIDPRQIGEAVYMLANGQGKGRMNKNIGSRKRLAWRLLFLSSGEMTLLQHLESAGKTAHAGLEVRLISITADAGAGMGMFENIHTFSDSKEFAEYLTSAAYKCYGAPIREFLKKVTVNRIRVAGRVRERMEMFARDSIPATAPSEVRRAGRRFGLCVAAGELATEWGLTGWDLNEVAPLIQKCLEDWITVREPNDTDRGVRAIRQFIELHGASRFQSTKPADSDRVINRAGYRREAEFEEDTMEFLFQPEVFRSEVCRGFDSGAVLQLLKDKGFLICGADGKLTKQVRITGIGKQRFYCISSAIFE